MRAGTAEGVKARLSVFGRDGRCRNAELRHSPDPTVRAAHPQEAEAGDRGGVAHPQAGVGGRDEYPFQVRLRLWEGRCWHAGRQFSPSSVSISNQNATLTQDASILGEELARTCRNEWRKDGTGQDGGIAFLL